MAEFYAELGSVSSGTMRPEDLIPAFINALDEIRDNIPLSCEHGDETGRVAIVSRIDNIVGEIEGRMNVDPGDGFDYYQSEEADWDMEELSDLLQGFAPPFAYFGSHEGDGSDYGYWVSWESIDEALESGEIISVDGIKWIPEELAAEFNLDVDVPLYALADRLEDDGREEADIVRQLDTAKYVMTGRQYGDSILYTKDGKVVWSV